MKRFALYTLAAVAVFSLVFAPACSKSGGDPMDEMIKHTTAMIQIIKDNKDDCDKVVKELNAYTDSHKKEFEELSKKGKEMEKNMSDEDKKKYAEKAMKKMEPILKDSMSVMMEINKKCPEHAAKIGQAMRAIK